MENRLDFSHICRTCLIAENIYKNLYEANISKMINECRFIEVSVNDGFPKNICIRCQELVVLTYNFKKQCEKSQATLKEYSIQIENENVIKSGLNKNVYDIQKHLHDDATVLEKHVKFNINLNSCDSNDHLNKNFAREELSQNINANQVDLDENLTAFLEQDSPPPLPHKCLECTQSFSVEHDLKLHISTHVKSEDYVCLNCNKKFATRQMLKRHIKTHMLHKPHSCGQCGKGFAESHALTKHMRSHTGVPREKKHLCAECGQGFSEPFYLNVHMRKHTGERPLMCSSCGKSFADPRSLKAHNMIHTGETPHKCHFCKLCVTMANWPVNQVISAVKSFILTQSIVQIQRRFHREFNLLVRAAVPSRNAILRWIRDVDEGASVNSKFVGGTRTVCTQANIERTRIAVERSPTRSAIRHSIALRISQ